MASSRDRRRTSDPFCRITGRDPAAPVTRLLSFVVVAVVVFGFRAINGFGSRLIAFVVLLVAVELLARAVEARRRREPQSERS